MFETITLAFGFLTITIPHFTPPPVILPTPPPPPAIVRTQAASALKEVVERKGYALNGITRDVEDGGDIILACIEEVFGEWGQKVYSSVLADPNAQDQAAMTKYISAYENKKNNLNIISEGRGDLLAVLRSTRKTMTDQGQWPAVPADLGFLNYPNYSATYLQSLATCENEQFLATVNSNIAPLAGDPLIDGNSVTDPASHSLVIASDLPTIGSNNGITAGEGLKITITDKSTTYGKVRSYSDWIRTLSRSNY